MGLSVERFVFVSRFFSLLKNQALVASHFQGDTEYSSLGVFFLILTVTTVITQGGQFA